MSMESEDVMKEESEEANEGEEEEEEREEEDGDGGEEGEGEDELEEGDEECLVRFEGDINPLDFVEDGISEVQLYQQFEQLEYKALAEKKRKASAAAIQGEGSVKKRRPEITAGATFAEIEEALNYGARRRSKKPKKRGRRKGSRNKLSPEITKKIGDANLCYAHGRYDDDLTSQGSSGPSRSGIQGPVSCSSQSLQSMTLRQEDDV